MFSALFKLSTHLGIDSMAEANTFWLTFHYWTKNVQGFSFGNLVSIEQVQCNAPFKIKTIGRTDMNEQYIMWYGNVPELRTAKLNSRPYLYTF